MKHIIAAFAILIGLASPAAATSLYTSDNGTTGFDATTAGSLPTGWANKIGTWSASTTTPLTGHTHSLKDGTPTDGDVVLETGATATADMEVSYSTIAGNDGTHTAALSAIVRSDSANANQYLCLVAGPTSVLLFKKVSGTYSQIGSGATLGFTITDGMKLGVRFRAVGTTLQCRVWDASGAEPTTWVFNTTDGSVSAAGFAGLYDGQGSYTGGTVTVASDFNIDSINSGTNFLTTLGEVPATGATITVSGTYSGSAPSGLNYSVDGGSYSAASSPTISGGNFSFSITTPTPNGFHSIDVQDSVTTASTSPGIYNVTAGVSPVTINPNDASIVYSPYNWNVSASHGITINSGAYFRMLFTGTSVVLNFNVSAMASPASEIWWRVDGYGPWTKANVAATVTPTIPSALLSKTNIPYHLLEVMVKSTTQGANRWNTAVTTTAVDMTSITLDSGAAVATPQKAPRNCLVYGDSINEGVLTLAESATNDVDRNDAKIAAAGFPLGNLLGCEIGVIGFGGQGYVTVGTVATNVPTFPNSYNLLYSGVSQTFSPTPDLVVIEEGTNDGSTDTTTAATGVFNNISTAVGSTVPVAVLRPLNGTAQATFLQNAIAAATHPTQFHYINTAGFFNTSLGVDSGGLHPSGPNAVAVVAPKIAGQLKTLLTGGSPAGVITGMLQAPW